MGPILILQDKAPKSGFILCVMANSMINPACLQSKVLESDYIRQGREAS